MTKTKKQKINGEGVKAYLVVVKDTEYWLEHFWEIVGPLPLGEKDVSLSGKTLSTLRYWGLKNLAKRMHSVADNINELAETVK